MVGGDPVVLRQRADEVKAAMRDNANTRGVNDNWNEFVKVLRLEVDQSKARALGVTSQSIAQASKIILAGTTVGQLREGDKLIDIVLRQPLQERSAITDIANAYLPTASGRAIPLLQIARPSFGWEPGVMWRENRDYAITVQSDVAEGLQGATVTAELSPRLKALEAQWAQQGMGGYRIQIAGAVEENSKGSASIAVGVPIMLFITFTLLMLQLHSFSRAVLVFLTGPMGIAGVAGALLLLDRPFGFVALLGVIALMGMIQRNSVILIDQIEQDRAAGVPTLGRHCGERGASAEAHCADCRSGCARHDSAVALGVLGPDGRCHHGRPHRCDRAHPACAACDVCGLVSCEAINVRAAG